MDFRVSELPGALLVARTELAPHLTPNWFDLNFWHRSGQRPDSAPGRGESYFLEHDGLAMVWRHYRRGGMAAKLSEDRYLWFGLPKTRLWKELAVTETLYQQGLPVPRPLGGLIRRQSIWYSADLLTERLPHARSLADLLASEKAVDWTQLGATLAQFHHAGLDHVDLNARNILFSNDNPYLIDFDRCRFRQPAHRWQQSNLARLERSLHKLFPQQSWQSALDQLRAGYKKN